MRTAGLAQSRPKFEQALEMQMQEPYTLITAWPGGLDWVMVQQTGRLPLLDNGHSPVQQKLLEAFAVFRQPCP